ncbi:hypothetical protein [Leucobacter sp. USHLN153]
MTEAIQAGLDSLIKDGTYGEILGSAVLESGARMEATINAGDK